MSNENVLDFAPPNLNPPLTEEVPRRPLTRGEHLAGVNFDEDFALRIVRHRAARTIDALRNLPLAILHVGPPNAPSSLQHYDPEHRMIIEEAVRRQLDALMWSEKALTWKGKDR